MLNFSGFYQATKLDESWSDGVSSDRNRARLSAKAKQHLERSTQLHKLANKIEDKESSEYKKLKSDAHIEYASHIRASYHNGEWGSYETAKKDYEREVNLAYEGNLKPGAILPLRRDKA